MRFRRISIAACAVLALAACGSDQRGALGAARAEAREAIVASTAAAAPSRVNEASTTAPSSVAPSTSAPASTAPPATAPPANSPAPAAPPVLTAAPAPPETAPPAAPAPAPASGKPCIVSLHGKGGGGQAEWTGGDGVRHSFPAGNAAGWDGRQWLYYPAGNYQAARAIVANDIAGGGCGRVVVYGFSNGAAFAAKLFCRGETFGGTVVGYVIDDPVVDHAVEGCARPAARVVLYWTGDIDQPDGWPCGDWTCEGDSTIGIARYEAEIGVSRTPSIHSTHRQYVDPPELHSWL